MSALGRGQLISYIIIYHLSRNTLYRFAFSPVCSRLEFSSLKVKYDIFGYGDEGTWQKHPDKYSQHKIVDLSLSNLSWTSCSRKDFTVEEYKHTHTHTHTRARAREASKQTLRKFKTAVLYKFCSKIFFAIFTGKHLCWSLLLIMLQP